MRLTGSIVKVLTNVHQKFWLKLCRNSRSRKSPWTIAHKNRQNWGLSCPGNIWPFKWNVLAVRANWLHNKALNRLPRKILAKIMSEFQITKKSINYSTRKSAKCGVYLIRGTFDLQNGMYWPWGLTGFIAKVLTVVHEKFGKIMSEFQITKKSMDYRTRKLAKWGVYMICGKFDLQNGTFWMWGLTGSIAKVLKVAHEKFWQKLCQDSRPQ